MSLTLREAIDRTLLRISLAQGVDVQTYSEEPIKQIVQHKFNILFDAVWWPQFYNPGVTLTLDGVTGVVTASLRTTYGIKRHMDIRYVWYKDERNPLPRAPVRLNPSLIKRRSIVAYNDPEKLFKVVPADTTGNVTISFREKPDDFADENDVIDMDEDLIILGSAYDYLNGIGTNPEEEAKLLRMFDSRFKTLSDQVEAGELSVDSYDTTYDSTAWQEVY